MKMKLPHPFVLLLSAVLVAVAMTWIVPAGEYERRADAATGRGVVIPGSYTRVAQAPVGAMGALMAVPLGVVNGADVIICILLVGGAFALLDTTGALGRQGLIIEGYVGGHPFYTAYRRGRGFFVRDPRWGRVPRV